MHEGEKCFHPSINGICNINVNIGGVSAGSAYTYKPT